jgi:signal peptidase I
MKLSAYLLASMIACAPLAFLHPVRVKGGSMEQTYRDGQLVFALWPWCSGGPGLGEAWIVAGPEGPIVKRLLALPGQELEERNGYLLRDGQLVEEPYIASRGIGSGGPWNAQGGYLFLGDNRPNSKDCRLWGPLQKTALKGRIIGGKH